MQDIRLFYLSCTLALALLLGACTQTPAGVVERGDDFFGRTASVVPAPMRITAPIKVAADPVMTAPSATAPLSSVAVSDMAPIPAHAPVVQETLPSAAPATPSRESHLLVPPATPQASAAPFIWPVGGKVIAHFGHASGTANDGISIAAPAGEPIHASAAGKVVYAGDGLRGYGNLVLIQHKNGWVTSYAHAQRITVKKGQTVAQGQVIGTVGTSGSVHEPQLHFALRHGKTPVNPQNFLSPSQIAAR